ERRRFTWGTPAIAASSGTEIELSSSSGAIAAFCTITLNTGAERSGNTSRGTSDKKSAPTVPPPSASKIASSGRANHARMIQWIALGRSVLMVFAFTARLVGLRLQEKRALNDDALAGRKPGHDLDLAAEITPASHRTPLECFLAARDEDAPAVVHPLQSRNRHCDQGARRLAQGDPGGSRHSRP